jgi:hypothetical protein
MEAPAQVPAPPQDFLCPITRELMVDPVSTGFSSLPAAAACLRSHCSALTCLLMQLLQVVVVETGQSYERSALLHWWSGGNYSCPTTGKPGSCRAL